MALATGVTALLALTTAIRPQPWFDPHYAIPLAGIVLGNVLNASPASRSTACSAASGGSAPRSRRGWRSATPYRAAIAPAGAARRSGAACCRSINQMSAAGLVTLPGIMTGQILAGLDPLEAAKYQILLMFLLSGGGGLAAVIVAHLAAWRLGDRRDRLRLDRLR